MRLKILLHNIITLSEGQDCEITGISQDSRTIRAGELFCAYPGIQTDGRDYITEAIQKGACAVLIEPNAVYDTPTAIHSIPIIAIHALRNHISEIAARFYGYPSHAITLIGITGTNGKSSCTHFIAACLAQAGQPCGVIGGITHGIYQHTPQGAYFSTIQASNLSTPDAITLQHLLAQFRDKGIRFVTLEISSHGLSQGRLNSLLLTIAGFTNLTQDHLDYHQTFTEYAETKKKLFLKSQLQYAVLNQDDPHGVQWQQTLSQQPLSIYRYTLHPSQSIAAPLTTCYAKVMNADVQGIYAQVHTPWGKGVFINPYLVGNFNVSNLLLVLTVLSILQIPLSDSLRYINTLQPLLGRMEKFTRHDDQPLVVIDYAHTPDALKQALQALTSSKGKLWCVFGCGGHRDTDKRPKMGAIAEKYADQVILTQDNSRDEQGSKIIQSILAGMHYPQAAWVEMDRAQAIRHAIQAARPEDTILIAGKGHETYQILQGTHYPFSDHLVAEQVLLERA